MDIMRATRTYEQLMASRLAVVRSDLVEKHTRMRESPFVLLRGTFYRWVELWPSVCSELVGAPRLLAVGDLHIENFGTWRDAEGRLIWGVNDVDECAVLPYASDLVRLATSAVLAARDAQLELRRRAICDAILDGYTTSLGRGGQAIVLAERRAWLRGIATSDLRDPKPFWEKMLALGKPSRPAPAEAVRALESALPNDVPDYTLRHRTAGVGSLGRPRLVALAAYCGGYIAREAKALLPSAAVGDSGPPRRWPALDLMKNAVRARDPFWAIEGVWVVRRLAPDCSRIEIEDLPRKRDERRLLRAMGYETANLHLATKSARSDVVKHLRAQRAGWLERAVAGMVSATVDDWKAWVGTAR